MRLYALSIPLLFALAPPAAFQFGAGTPTVITVQPDSCKVGDEVEAQGSYLGRETVAALYLTNGKGNLKVAIIQQSATAIRFRIPFAAEPGRYTLLVLVTGRERNLVQEPVQILIEPATTHSANRAVRPIH